MLRWLKLVGGSSSELPENERYINSPENSLPSSIFGRIFTGPNQRQAVESRSQRSSGAGDVHRPNDDRDMEEGIHADFFPLKPEQDWGVQKEGDAAVVVAVHRTNRAKQSDPHQQQVPSMLPQQHLPPRPPRPSLATPPPPMAIPLWLQRRQKGVLVAPPVPAAPQPPPPPCPLRPCPPSSSGPRSLRVESFTAGTAGRLMRPGVGIGSGVMKEARYADLRFIHQIGEGGFGKVRYLSGKDFNETQDSACYDNIILELSAPKCFNLSIITLSP